MRYFVCAYPRPGNIAQVPDGATQPHLGPAALSDLPCRAHFVWSDTAIDLGVTVLVGAGESPIFYTEHREEWYAGSAAGPLARMVGSGADHFDGLRCTRPGHTLVLTAIGVAETQRAAPDSREVSKR
jgi:hypothetical protein